MTQAETSRGPGKPRSFDEDELLARVRSIDDLVRIREALEANGEGLLARNTFGWLAAKWAGDPTGGGVSRMTETRYRTALARLGRDPLRPTGVRRRSRPQRGSAELVLVGAVAGAGALALAAGGSQGASFALLQFARAIADNAPVEPDALTDRLAA